MQMELEEKITHILKIHPHAYALAYSKLSIIIWCEYSNRSLSGFYTNEDDAWEDAFNRISNKKKRDVSPRKRKGNYAKPVGYISKIKEKIERECENPKCSNTFLTKGSRHFCSGPCLRNVRGRKGSQKNIEYLENKNKYN